MALRSHLRSTTAAARFAHLLGFGAADPKDDETETRRAAGEDNKDREAAADDEMDCPECDGSGEDEDGDKCDACDGTGKVDAKKGKKAKASDEEACDEEKSEDEDTRKAARAGRRFERARCFSIFAHKAAAVRPDLAAHLAFTTSLSAAAAVDLLAAAAAGHNPKAAPRASRPRLDLGGDAGGGAASGPANLAAQIVAAGKKRRNEAA